MARTPFTLVRRIKETTSEGRPAPDPLEQGLGEERKSRAFAEHAVVRGARRLSQP